MMLPVLQNSPFLMALGWAIANSIWQSGLLWAAYHCSAGSGSNLSSRHKNALSTVLVFVSFCWFIYTFLAKLTSTKSVAELNYSLTGMVNQTALPPVYDFENILSVLKFSLPYFSIAYIILLCILFIKFFKAYQASVFIRRYGVVTASDEWLSFTKKAASKIRINRSVSIWFSTHINVPATVGFLKPVILIPLASLNQLTTDQLEAIILHELAHIQRNDYLINIIVSVIETILFFNPFIVLMIKIIKRERENCCDDLVIHYKYDRHSYASALVSIEKKRLNNYELAMSATSGKNQLLNRVKRIVENRKDTNNFNYGQKLLALLAITAIIFSISRAYPHQQFNSRDKRVIAVDRKSSDENIYSVSKDSLHAVSQNIRLKKPAEQSVHHPITVNKENISPAPSIDKSRASDENDSKESVDVDKRIAIIDNLNELINADHQDIAKDYEFNFNMNLASLQNNINDIDWNQIFSEKAFKYFYSEILDKDIKGVPEQAKKTTQIKKAIFDQQNQLNDLRKQYEIGEIQWKKVMNDKEVFENFRRLKMDTLTNDRLMNLNYFEEPLIPFETADVERKEKKFGRNRGIQSRLKTHSVSQDAKIVHKLKEYSNISQMPVTIDFNGKKLVMDNKGLKVKKPGKTSTKNIKKIILAFGEEIVHVHLDD